MLLLRVFKLWQRCYACRCLCFELFEVCFMVTVDNEVINNVHKKVKLHLLYCHPPQLRPATPGLWDSLNCLQSIPKPIALVSIVAYGTYLQASQGLCMARCDASTATQIRFCCINFIEVFWCKIRGPLSLRKKALFTIPPCYPLRMSYFQVKTTC